MQLSQDWQLCKGWHFLTLPFKLSSKGRWGPAPKQETFYETVAVTFCCMMCYCGWGPSYILMIRWFCPFKRLIIKESQINNEFDCLVLFTNFYKVDAHVALDQLLKSISKTFMNVYFFCWTRSTNVHIAKEILSDGVTREKPPSCEALLGELPSLPMWETLATASSHRASTEILPTHLLPTALR